MIPCLVGLQPCACHHTCYACISAIACPIPTPIAILLAESLYCLYFIYSVAHGITQFVEKAAFSFTDSILISLGLFQERERKQRRWPSAWSVVRVGADPEAQ